MVNRLRAVAQSPGLRKVPPSFHVLGALPRVSPVAGAQLGLRASTAPATISAGVHDCMSLGAFFLAIGRTSLMAPRPTPQSNSGKIGTGRAKGESDSWPTLTGVCWRRRPDGTRPDPLTSPRPRPGAIVRSGDSYGPGAQPISIGIVGSTSIRQAASIKIQAHDPEPRCTGIGLFDNRTDVMRRQVGRRHLLRPTATPSHDARCAAAGRRSSDRTSHSWEAPLVS